jgi:hypothetical protein
LSTANKLLEERLEELQKDNYLLEEKLKSQNEENESLKSKLESIEKELTEQINILVSEKESYQETVKNLEAQIPVVQSVSYPLETRFPNPDDTEAIERGNAKDVAQLHDPLFGPRKPPGEVEKQAANDSRGSRKKFVPKAGKQLSYRKVPYIRSARFHLKTVLNFQMI